MSKAKVRQSLSNLKKALNRLQEVVDQENDAQGILVDAAIQRFEFSIELFWKTMKRLLQEEGISAGTPKDVLKHAFQQQWFDDEAAWLGMLEDRNRTSHLYDESTSLEIFKRIKTNYAPEFHRTYQLLKSKFPDLFDE